MFNATHSLLDQIEQGALDSKAPLADVLRKCVALGGRAGSDQLRDWARTELDGYAPDEEVPRYRVIPAVIAIDGANSAWKWTGQQLSSMELPDFARDVIRPEVELRQGVAELERVASSSDESIRLQHSAMADLVTYMNTQGDVVNGTISRMYWQVSANSFHGVVDIIRTTLVSLVAELRAVGVTDTPTAEAANHAVQVVVHRAKRSTIQVNTNHLMGDGTAIAQVNHEHDGDGKRGLPTWLTAPWTIAIGLATIVAGVTGIAVWLDWNPFG